MVLVFGSELVEELSTGIGFIKRSLRLTQADKTKIRKLIAGRVSPDKDRVWFFNGSLEIISGRLWTIWTSRKKTVIRINQLSKTKICSQ
jgi:hypothetical protein